MVSTFSSARKPSARVQELSSALRTVSLNGGPALQAHLGDIREAIGTELGLAYAVSDAGDRLVLRFLRSTRRVDLASVRGWLATVPRETRWAAYNALRPERAQRNRVHVANWADRRRRPTLVAALDSVLGIVGHGQIRSLICEGASLLAWVGGTQSGPIEDWQRRALAALIDPLRERLVVEGRLERFPSTLAALEAALEQIPAPAFIATGLGHVSHANEAGQASLHEDRAATLEAIRRGLAGRPAEFSMTPIATRAEGSYFLAIARPRRLAGAQAAAAACRMSLTGRQRQVLERLMAGEGNDQIADALGIARSTVEKHVSALLVRVGVESRAALIARVASLA